MRSHILTCSIRMGTLERYLNTEHRNSLKKKKISYFCTKCWRKKSTDNLQKHSGATFNHGQEADDTGAVQDTLHRTHSTGNTPHCISLHLSTLMIALNQENTAMHHFRGRENTSSSRKYYCKSRSHFNTASSRKYYGKSSQCNATRAPLRSRKRDQSLF